MKNLNYLKNRTNYVREGSEKGSGFARLDSHSILSRQSVFAIVCLLLLGTGQVWGWNWESGNSVIWDWGAANQTNAYFTVGNGDGNKGACTMTRLGNSGQFTYTDNSTWNNYGWAAFSTNTNWGLNTYRTTAIEREVNGNMYVCLNTKKSCSCSENDEWNWQEVTSPKKGTSGYAIYFDDTNTNWGGGNMYFKYGVDWSTGGYNRNIAFSSTKVPGTNNLYILTSNQNDATTSGATNANGQLSHDIYYSTWYISKEVGWTGNNTINDDAHLTARTAAQTSNISGNVTLIPTAISSGNGTSGNPNIWTTTVLSGFTRTVTITTPSHGTITVTYTDYDESEMTKTSGVFNVAHTCIITVSATPDDGYTLSSLTVGGESFLSGSDKIVDSDITISASFTAKSYTVSLNKQTSVTGYGGTAGTISDQSVTYDATLPTISQTMPSAANGYTFMGFYTDEFGGGEKLINANRTWVSSVDGYTDGSSHWIHDGDITLYAYYKPATVAFEFDASSVNSETNIYVTPTLTETPVGTEGTNYKVCYEVQYADGTPLSPQPQLKKASDNSNYTTGVGFKVYFTAPSATGLYRFAAIVYSGSACGSGSMISSTYANFTVVSEHNVIVNSMCSSTQIANPVTVTGKPLDWTLVYAHYIFGYSFSGWTHGDGITTASASDEELSAAQDEDPTIVAAIKIKADYDDVLTANYTQKQYVYFKNNLDWENVYIYFYNGDYWTGGTGNGSGTGAKSIKWCNDGISMSSVPGTTDLYYFDYSVVSSPTAYIAFSELAQCGYDKFAGNNKVVYRSDFASATPMFVPAASQTGIARNSGAATYYNEGYWTKYTKGTGYYLKVYDSDSELIKTVEFTSSEADELMPMRVITDLEANTTYKFKLYREDGTLYGNTGTMYSGNSGTSIAWAFTSGTSYCTLRSSAAGNYTFTLTYAADAGTWALRIGVDFPVAIGDYRVLYKDNEHTNWHPSAVIPRIVGTDTVSFFVRYNDSPVLKLQKCTNISDNGTTTTVTWTDSIANMLSPKPAFLTKDTIYNFGLDITENVSNGLRLSLGGIRYYSGEYYIRTDCAPSKWDNYANGDHLMVYSDYAELKSGYSHYFVKFVNKGTNIKFTIANDYSPCISDTLIGDATAKGPTIDGNGFMTAPNTGVNVRFMWNRKTNALSRAYITGPVSNTYLCLRSLTEANDEDAVVFKDKNGTRLNSVTLSENATSYTLDTLRFADNTNWIYQADVYAKPGAKYKLTADVNGTITFFKGIAGDYSTEENLDELIGGTGSSLYHIRMMYDFKTNRMMKAWVPEGKISDDLEINADVMLVREGQGDAQQITFGLKPNPEDGYGSLSNVETIYGVMQFNKWTLNNKSKTGEHTALSPVLSTYERDLYWISFPFDVNLSDVFGFGTYGKHWIVEYYDGKGRARNGFWADSPSNWKFVTTAMKDTFKLEKYVGYILALDLDSFALDNSRTWANDAETRELYFPSTGVTTIGNQAVVVNINQTGYECSIDRRTPAEKEAGTSNTNKDRRIADSYWHCIGVPNYSNNSHDNANPGNIANLKTSDLPFLYRWNATDNSLSTVAGGSYDFKAMNSYLVQYAGTTITWAAASSTTSSVAARVTEMPDRTYNLALIRDEEEQDHTYVRLTDDASVTNRFEFNYDLSKEYNAGRGNIWTVTADTVEVAGNSMPKPLQTTLVPVGVKVVANGEYTLAMPEGTNGEDVFLIDNAYGTRTNLGLTDYTVTLTPGTYDGRFALEFGPIQDAPTGIDEMSTVNYQLSTEEVRKVFVGGRLYIIRDGKVYDAAGQRVE